MFLRAPRSSTSLTSRPTTFITSTTSTTPTFHHSITDSPVDASQLTTALRPAACNTAIMFKLVRPCFPLPGRAVAAALRSQHLPLARPTTTPLRLAARRFSLDRPSPAQPQAGRAVRPTLPPHNSHQRRPYNYQPNSPKPRTSQPAPIYDSYTQVRLQAAKPIISTSPLLSRTKYTQLTPFPLPQTGAAGAPSEPPQPTPSS